MRILMLDNEFPPLGGGTGVVNFHILRELAHYDDISVDLVTASRTRTSYETSDFAPRIKIYKVPVDNRNIHHSTCRELIWYFLRGLRLCMRLIRQNRYDLSLAFAGVPAGAISYLLKLRFGLPYWVSLQGPDVPGFEARYRYLYPVLTPWIRRIWKQANVVTAISDDHQKLAHKTVPDIKIAIVHNGVDGSTFFPSCRPKQSSTVDVICVGRLIERKGQGHLLEAFYQIVCRDRSCARLTFVGTGDAEDPLRRRVTELNIGDLVTFRGYVPTDQMAEIYRAADIFVLPSENEGMSMALLEALASGLPVIVTDVGGTAELVTHGVNGLIVPWGDVTSLTRSLETLIGSHRRRAEMGRVNRQMSVAFDWTSIAARYVALFHQTACSNLIEVTPRLCRGAPKV